MNLQTYFAAAHSAVTGGTDGLRAAGEALRRLGRHAG